MASEECSITIPSEIITDILYRLPAKSVGRFRCVSKGWLSLLTQPHFIKTHQNTLNQHHMIVLFSDDKSFYTFPFHLQEAGLSKTKVLVELPNFNIIKCYDSCEGLVLMSAYDSAGLHKLVVINPTTKKFLELPESGFEKVDHMLGIHIMYVFCYDSVTDDYTVVTISYFHYNHLIPPDTISLHVYSLRTNTWKWLIDYPFNLYAWIEFSNAFVNGRLHWLAKKGYDDVLPVIVAFSLADKKFTEVPIPYMGYNVDIMSKNGCKLVVLDGKLAIVFKDEVWLMYEYGVTESWTKMTVLHGLGEIPMVVDDNRKLLVASGDRLLIHNLDEQTCSKTVCIWSRKDLKVKGTYVESLVSPKFS